MVYHYFQHLYGGKVADGRWNGMTVIVSDRLPRGTHYATAISFIRWPSAQPLLFTRPGDKLYSDEMYRNGDTLFISPANWERLRGRL